MGRGEETPVVGGAQLVVGGQLDLPLNFSCC